MPEDEEAGAAPVPGAPVGEALVDEAHAEEAGPPAGVGPQLQASRGQARSEMRWELAEEMLYRLKENFFSHLLMLILGLVPLLIAVGFLILAAAMTGLTYFTAESAWAVALQWFFMMIPFAALVSPATIFFFNFAAESFVWMQKR